MEKERGRYQGVSRAVAMTGLAVMGFGGIGKSLRLFTRKVHDHSQQGVTGHPSRHLGDSSNVDYGDSQGASEGNNCGGSLQTLWPAAK